MKVPGGGKPIQECVIVVLEMVVCSTKLGINLGKKKYGIRLWEIAMRNQENASCATNQSRRGDMMGGTKGAVCTKNNETDTLSDMVKSNKRFH